MDNIKASKKIFSIEDAKKLSKKRLPKIVYDFIDGASGDEKLSEINSFALDQIRLEPRVLRNVEERKLKKSILGFNYDYPFGFAPMGMTNLSWPGADSMLAKESARNNIPTCVSMASTTTLEKMYELSEGHSWLQLYIFQDEAFVWNCSIEQKKLVMKLLYLLLMFQFYLGELEMIKMDFHIHLKLDLNNFLILQLIQFGQYLHCLMEYQSQ